MDPVLHPESRRVHLYREVTARMSWQQIQLPMKGIYSERKAHQWSCWTVRPQLLLHTEIATAGQQASRRHLANNGHHYITDTAPQSWTLILHKNQMTHFGLNMDVYRCRHWYIPASVDLLAFYNKTPAHLVWCIFIAKN